MADVYEQNLSQKTSLTTSDYIRVVGSDNVSYKQSIANALPTFGINNSIGEISSLDAIPTGVGLAYLNSVTGISDGWYLFHCETPTTGAYDLSLSGAASGEIYLCRYRSSAWAIRKATAMAVQTVSSSGTVSLSASGGTGTLTIDATLSGYTPVGVIAIAKTGAGNGVVSVTAYYVSGNNIMLSLYNPYSSALTIGATVTVLYKTA